MPRIAMTRNLSGLIAATFVLTTTLDIWTTWMGVNQFDYTEPNPLTDTGSIQAVAIPEVIALFIGIAMVTRAHTFPRRSRPLPDERFASFYKRFESRATILAAEPYGRPAQKRPDYGHRSYPIESVKSASFFGDIPREVKRLSGFALASEFRKSSPHSSTTSGVINERTDNC